MKKHTRTAKDSVTESSGNVFADLGIKDAAAYLAKSVLAIHIQRVIENRGAIGQPFRQLKPAVEKPDFFVAGWI